MPEMLECDPLVMRVFYGVMLQVTKLKNGELKVRGPDGLWYDLLPPRSEEDEIPEDGIVVGSIDEQAEGEVIEGDFLNPFKPAEADETDEEDDPNFSAASWGEG